MKEITEKTIEKILEERMLELMQKETEELSKKEPDKIKLFGLKERMMEIAYIKLWLIHDYKYQEKF